MKLVMRLVPGDDPEVVDAQIAFHLHAGVDAIVAAPGDAGAGADEVLEAYAAAGELRWLRNPGSAVRSAAHAELLRLAGAEPCWALTCEAGEFWWPRAPGLKDLLGALPARYGIVQALVRTFLSGPNDESFFAERLTVRRALPDSRAVIEAQALPTVQLLQRGTGAPNSDLEGDLLAPLRSWYPIEVLRFPSAPSSQETGALDDRALDQQLANGSLVNDTRLRDTLRAIRCALPVGARHFQLPSERESPLRLPSPNIVDDAAYAAEVASLGESDLARLQQRLDETEARLSRLEHNSAAHTKRKLARFLGRSRR